MKKGEFWIKKKRKMAGNRSRSGHFGQEFVPEALPDVEIPKIGMGTSETFENGSKFDFFLLENDNF